MPHSVEIAHRCIKNIVTGFCNDASFFKFFVMTVNDAVTLRNLWKLENTAFMNKHTNH